MKLIFCIDDNNGIMFNNRRQSRDSVLCERVAALCEGSVLWMSEYSAKLFEDADGLKADNDYMTKAGDDDFCFVEDRSLTPFKDRISGIYLFYWNRRYPADVFFDLPLSEYEMISQEDFPGYSHDKITLQKYVHRGNRKK